MPSSMRLELSLRARCATVSFTSDAGAWSLRAAPWIQGDGFLVLPAMSSDSSPTLLLLFPHLCPENQDPPLGITV